MGENYTRIHELWRKVDGLRGSLEGVTGLMKDLKRFFDDKVAQAVDKIKKFILMTIGGAQIEIPTAWRSKE